MDLFQISSGLSFGLQRGCRWPVLQELLLHSSHKHSSEELKFTEETCDDQARFILESSVTLTTSKNFLK